jgi:hypothetical protein
MTNILANRLSGRKPRQGAPTMPCTFCDSALPAGARYCPNCGTPTGTPPTGKFFSLAEPEYDPYPRAAAPVRPTCPTAVLSLVFGILCWFILPVIGAILAIVLGHQARTEIEEARGVLEGDAYARAGMLLGYLQLGLILLGLLVIIAIGVVLLVTGVLR